MSKKHIEAAHKSVCNAIDLLIEVRYDLSTIGLLNDALNRIEINIVEPTDYYSPEKIKSDIDKITSEYAEELK